MASLFISYRRADSRDICQHLAAKLMAKLGKRHVFLDIDSIAGGDVFPQRLADALRASEVVLVVIGPQWLSISDEYGRQRLADPTDFVRREVEEAILSSKTILPVLVHGALMPPAQYLPPSMQRLTVWPPLVVRDGPEMQRDLERAAAVAQRSALVTELRHMPRIAFPWLAALLLWDVLTALVALLGQGIGLQAALAKQVSYVSGWSFVITLCLALFYTVQRKLWGWLVLIVLLSVVALLWTYSIVALALVFALFSVAGPRLSQHIALLRLGQPQ